ncbi:MAG: integrin alpha [Planctomycetota bacterium]
MMRFLTAFVLGAFSLPLAGQGTLEILAQEGGCAAGSAFGSVVVDLGDLDGDGAREFAVSAPDGSAVASNAGTVWIYSLSTSGVRFIHRIEGDQASLNFGRGVAPAGDVDGDGIRDVWVSRTGFGAGGGFGGDVLLISGAHIMANPAPSGTGHCTGTAPDPWVTLIGATPPASGSPCLFRFETTESNSRFGWAIDADADLNADFISDLLVGAIDETSGGAANGAVWVLSGGWVRSRINGAGTLVELLDPVAPTSAGVILRIVGPPPTTGVAEFGLPRFVGDIDADGVEDFAIQDYTQELLSVYSGATRVLIKRFAGDTSQVPTPRFGFSFTGVGDLNGDGFGEIAVGAPGDAPTAEGDVWILDGLKTCDNSSGFGPFVIPDPETIVGTPAPTASVPVFRYIAGSALGAPFGDDLATRFGYALSSGDFDGDGTNDLLVGSLSVPVGFNRGLIVGFSGATFQELFRREGDDDFDALGISVAAIDDGNGNGRAELIATAPSDDLGGVDFGSVTVAELLVTELSDVAVIEAKQGGSAGAQFGWDLATIGDVNGDGVGDYAVGSRFAGFRGPGSGRVSVYDGADDSLLHHFDGAGGGDEIGRQVSRLGDVDGDGFVDFVIASRVVDTGAGFDTGATYVISGAYVQQHLGGTTVLSNMALSGAEIHVFLGVAANVGIGSKVNPIGDLDSDGLEDLAIASVAGAGGVGEVFVISASFLGANPGGVSTLTSAHPGLIHYLQGSELNGLFGSGALESVGLVDVDSVPDFVVGEQRAAGNRGRVYVYSGSTAQLIQSFEAPSIVEFGRRAVSLGDLDGDGSAEFAIAGSGQGVVAGSVWVLHGGTVAQLQALAGPIVLNDPQLGPCGSLSIIPPQPVYRCIAGDSATDFFATDMAAVDFDGDGFKDLAVGRPETTNGLTEVYSVAGAVQRLFAFNGDSPGDAFGSVMDSLGDRNADGRDDLIVGAPFNDQAGLDAGSIAIFGANVPYPGSGEDLVQGSGINEAPDGISVKFADVASATPQLLTYCLETPQGSFGGMAPVIIAQLALTSSLPPPIPAFPEVRMNIFDPTFTVLLDGNPANCAFCPSLPIDGRLELAYTIPMITVPDVSILIQGLALSGSANNGIFAASNTHEIRFR